MGGPNVHIINTRWRTAAIWDGRPFGHNTHGPKIRGEVCPFGRGKAMSPSNTMWPGPRPTSLPSGILIHPVVSPQQAWTKIRGAVPLWGRGAGSPSNTMWPGPSPTSLLSGTLIHPAVWPQQAWTDNWGSVHLWGRGAASPSDTVWPGPRLTSVPSCILIYPSVWPQQTWLKIGEGCAPSREGSCVPI